MKNSGFNRKIGILDWLIFLSIIIMIVMVYVPLEVWQEESKYKTEMPPISGPSEKCWENSWSFPTLTNQQKINLENLWNESLTP